jgi:hypothetical protein
MRRLGQSIGLWKCVWVRDCDDEWQLRIVHHWRGPGPATMRVLWYGPYWWPTLWGYLGPDGKIESPSYLREWKWA